MRKRAPGKKIGSCIYLHRSLQHLLPAERINAALTAAGEIVYDYIKFDATSGAFTFSECRDFDQASEPVVGRQWRVCGDFVKLLPARRDPMIIHGKHFFVADDYSGFDLSAAAARYDSFAAAAWIDRSRMGRLSWWIEHAYNSGRLDRYQDDAATRMGLTSRAAGAVGGLPLLYRSAAERQPGGLLLDYGCGRTAGGGVRPGASFLQAAGHKVVGYDRCHAAELASLTGQAGRFSTVLAANVLNVQRCRQDVMLTIWEAADLLAAGGSFLCSYPEAPRHAGLSVSELIECLWGGFAVIKRSRDGSAEIIECSQPLPVSERRYIH